MPACCLAELQVRALGEPDGVCAEDWACQELSDSPSTVLDVLGPNGEYIFVGGPAKVSNPAKFGRALQIAKAAADQNGFRAMYYLEAGTPESAIAQATKRFGIDNVFLFPKE